MSFRDVVTVGSTPAIRGEYVDGGTIATKLSVGAWPTEKQALACARGVLAGIAELHAVGRVHRDIKPANVALRDGNWEKPVVLDLGLVRDLVNASITNYPELLGTLPFMAPEQLRMERAVKRTDVFAVGVLVYLLLTQELPYVSDSQDHGIALDVLRRRMILRTESDEWPRWARVQQAMSDDIAQLLTTLLAPDAYARPTVTRASASLDALLAARA
jgi:serine/threonine-protein kinase